MTRLVLPLFLALFHIQALNAINEDFCSRHPLSGNYLCYDAYNSPIVCGCNGLQTCPTGEWFDPKKGGCSWSSNLLFRLRSCLQASVLDEDLDAGSPDNFCKDRADGNYPCDTSEKSKMCACVDEVLCGGESWYDPKSQRCTKMTEDLLLRLNTCLVSTPPPTPKRTPAPTTPPTLPPKGCPSSWKKAGNFCYKAIIESTVFQDAQKRCELEDSSAHLAYVLDAGQDKAIIQYLQQFRGSPQCRIHNAYDAVYYTSGQRQVLNNCKSNAVFVWRVSSSKIFPVSYTNWQDGEPNCYQGRMENYLTYRCLDSGSTCQWNDYLGSFTGCVLCQIDL